MSRPLRERLYSRLVADPETGCLLWTGHLDDSGYGRISVDGKQQRAHIAAWELDNGPVPEGLLLDHVKARGCAYRHCANIAHLEPVTWRENTLRGESFAAVNAVKTHCPHGHEYDLLNTYRKTDGGRDCRACNREAVRRYKARLRQLAGAS